MATFRRRGKVWQAIIRRKGHAPQYETFPNKAQAQRWAQQQEVRIGESRTRANDMTVAALLKKYGEDITPRKRSSRQEQSALKTLSEALGIISVYDLTPERVIEYVDTRIKVVKSDTVRKELNALKVAFDAAMALWGIHLNANPVLTAKGVLSVTKTLKPGVRRDRRPTPKELAALYASHLGPLVEFAVETGMRRGEIVAVRPEHIRGNTLLIPETKTDRPRTIPLSARAIALLKAGLPELKGDSISQAFTRVCARHKIRDLRWHDLRHEATSRFFERGLNMAEVRAITGHSLQSLQRYTHLCPVKLAERLDLRDQ